MTTPVASSATTVAADADARGVLSSTTPVHNAGGGDCMFYAMHYHLACLGHVLPSTRAVRRAAVEYAAAHWARYGGFAIDPVTGGAFKSVSDFATRFSQPGVDGDHVLLHALCRHFRVSCYIVEVDRLGGVRPPHLLCRHVGWPIVPLLFVPEHHYEALRKT